MARSNEPHTHVDSVNVYSITKKQINKQTNKPIMLAFQSIRHEKETERYRKRWMWMWMRKKNELRQRTAQQHQ